MQDEKKLLIELGEVVAVIVSNAAKLEICAFVKLIWA